MDSYSPLHDGSLYQAADEKLIRQQKKHMELLCDFNHTRPNETQKRAELLRRMLAEIGEGSFIEPPFFANWGGCFLHLGHHVYINHNLSLVDDTHIYIGDCTKLGPNAGAYRIQLLDWCRSPHPPGHHYRRPFGHWCR